VLLSLAEPRVPARGARVEAGVAARNEPDGLRC
jgi:hypothetical protein